MITKDTAVGLIIISLLLAMVAYGAQSLYSGGKLVQAKTQAADIASSARLWKDAKGQTNYTGVTIAAIGSTLNTPTSLSAPYGGNWGIIPNAADNTKFDLTLVADSDISAAVAAAVGNSAVGSYTVATKIVKVVGF